MQSIFITYCFLGDIYKGNLSVKDTDEEQSNLISILKDINSGVKPVEKRSFLNNIGLFLIAREKILNNFRSKIFRIKNTSAEQALNKHLNKHLNLNHHLNRNYLVHLKLNEKYHHLKGVKIF